MRTAIDNINNHGRGTGEEEEGDSTLCRGVSEVVICTFVFCSALCSSHRMCALDPVPAQLD
jgi:hypothetical protein